MNNNPPRVFISYSWDSETHKDWVRTFSERLRLNGVDIRLDQWHVMPGQSLTQFMESEIVACDHVITICTRNYFLKSLGRQGGVGYEQQIISGHLAAGVHRGKFIPVVREGEFEVGEKCAIPPHFLGIYAIDVRNDLDLERSQETLLRTVFKQPLLSAPEIGNMPTWVTDDRNEIEPEEVRLATLDLDGWQLNSGLAQHHRTPDTFYMPSAKERRSIVEGDVVKLIFEISIPYDPEDPEAEQTFGERMWVLVTNNTGPYYLGTLNNFPCTSDEQTNLSYGDKVVFLPEHVIDIQ
ncbi:TIR domain-containing protein [Pseudomonas ogarae]|uniref:TIR domain-containing protein n=1 Tax=Pseudomonas ogarae (strain DSM 112162 / CECT 30235 / F113) TaxID=1114970 RepID=UPI0013051FCB|nr:TIR domain-containing protein [Pseudomonas ogarae]